MVKFCSRELTKNYLAEKKSLLSKVKLPEGDLKELTEVESKLVTHKKKLQSLKTLKVEGATNYFNKIESGRKHLLVSAMQYLLDSSSPS